MKKKNICPVCGFDGLSEAAFDEHGMPSYEVCPCCGFEFGFDSQNDPVAFGRYRATWLKSGASWFLKKRKPKRWNKLRQLKNLSGSQGPR
jgi:hypothetical protein